MSDKWRGGWRRGGSRRGGWMRGGSRRGGSRRGGWMLVGVLVLVAAVLPGPASAALPPIKHVYIIVLENQSASTTFAPNSPAPYLAQTLRGRGLYLPNYHGVGHESLDNYVAMISGQAPNPMTQSDCQFYSDFAGATTGSYGQLSGAGCVYPAGVPTIASQLQGAGLTWRSYNDSMGADPAREASVCGHPPVNGMDNTQSATATDQYAARHDPFVYFHSIIDDTTLCDTHVVNLASLPQDLQNANGPNYTFITPSLCNDGHDTPCKNGQPGGLAQANSFLQQWVPQILNSPGYKQGGLLIINFDEAATSDTSACCGEIPGPGSPQPGITGPGGGDTGAVLLSPYIHPGTTSSTAYNHYTLLRSIEDLFGLGHIGYAQLPGETSFGSDVFACAPPSSSVALTRVHLKHHRLSFYSLQPVSLRVKVRGHKTIKRTLAACRSYSIKLPHGHHRVRITAGPQKLKRRY